MSASVISATLYADKIDYFFLAAFLCFFSCFFHEKTSAPLGGLRA